MKRTRLFGNNRNLKVLLLALVALGSAGLAHRRVRDEPAPHARPQHDEHAVLDPRQPAPEPQHPAGQPRRHQPVPDPATVAVPARDRRQGASSNIAAQHPKAIAFDIQFSQPSSQGQNDEVAFLNAIGNAQRPSCCRGPPPTRRPAMSRFSGWPRPRRRSARPGSSPPMGCSPTSRVASIARCSTRSTSSTRSRSSPPASPPATRSSRSREEVDRFRRTLEHVPVDLLRAGVLRDDDRHQDRTEASHPTRTPGRSS